MGQPKATLTFYGQTLLERIVSRLRPAFDEIVIVAAPEAVATFSIDVAGTRVVRDEREYEGPLQALARGLDAIGCDAAFACSCDLPLLDAGVSLALCGMLEDCDAVIPEVGGLLQPLHAVYRRDCARLLDAMTARGEKRMLRIADRVKTRRVGEHELRSIDPEMRSFVNVNTPEEYSRVLALLSRA